MNYNATALSVDIGNRALSMDIGNRASSTPTKTLPQEWTPKQSMSPCYRQFQQFCYINPSSPERIDNDEPACLNWSPSLIGDSDFSLPKSSPGDQLLMYHGGEYEYQTAHHRRALFSSASTDLFDDREHPLMFPQISLDDPQDTPPPLNTPIDVLSYNRVQRPDTAMPMVGYSMEKDAEICSIIMESHRMKNLNILEMCVTDANLMQYTIAADKLKVKEVKEWCEGRYIRQLQKETCLNLFQTAVSLNCQTLLAESMNVICEYFGFIWQTDMFRHLGGRALMVLLDNKKIQNHSDINHALKWWLSVDRNCQAGLYRKLVEQYLPNDNTTTKESIEKLKTDTKFNYILLFTCDGRKKQPKILLIDTKRSKLSSPSISCNIGPEYAACSGTIREAPYLFLCGGLNDSAKCLCKLDVVKNKWKNCKKMHNRRSRHQAEMVQEKVYVVGGCHDGKNLSSIEQYDPEKNTWIGMTDLVYPVRSAMSVVHGKKVYVFGGKLSNSMPISVIQCFDPATDTVTCVGELPVACSCGAAVVCGKKVYIATGNGELFMYDLELGVTETCARQLTGRKHFGMYPCDGRIYIAGGLLDTDGDTDKEPVVDSVDVYDPLTDRWLRTGWSINTQMGIWSIPKLMPIFSTCQISKYKPFQTGFGYTVTKEVDLDDSP